MTLVYLGSEYHLPYVGSAASTSAAANGRVDGQSLSPQGRAQVRHFVLMSDRTLACRATLKRRRPMGRLLKYCLRCKGLLNGKDKCTH